MTIGEYEERFRIPARSLHQFFMEIEGPKRTRRRRRRRLVTATLLAVVTLTAEVASHHTAQSPTGERYRGEPVLDVLPREVWHILDQVTKRLERLVDRAESFLRHARAQKAASSG